MRSVVLVATLVGRNSHERKGFCRDLRSSGGSGGRRELRYPRRPRPAPSRSRELEGMHAVTITHTPQHRSKQEAGDGNGFEITRAPYHGNRFTATLVAPTEE